MSTIPSLERVQELSKEGNTIPIYKRLTIDTLTPISAYLKLTTTNKEYSFLFESILGGEKIGRYSFVGALPRKIINEFKADPLINLESEFSHIKSVKIEGLPDFTGGAVGFISYDCVQYFEPTTKCNLADPFGMPDAVLMLFDTIVIFDHLHSVIKVCSNIFLSSEPTSEEIAQKYESAQLEIKKVEDLLNVNETVFPTQDFSLEDEESVANFGENEYKGFVESVKEKILVGEVFQTVPSRRIKRKTNLNPFNAYRRLRTVNPSPYMFYLDLKDFHLVGASPEMLVKVQERKVFMHPIAGTRKRGSTPEKDDAMANELIMDLKERSEHVMLVDLGRNDVNRVCDPKTVKVDSLMHIERYAHVMHIVSNVSGILRKDKTPYDAFRSIFPAGTVSGSPKVRAMQLIYDLEKEKRGAYAGAVGHFGYDGEIDTCIAIRTMVFKDGYVYLQAGGGIVYDSNPDDEYLETVNKLRSNVITIQEAESQFRK